MRRSALACSRRCAACDNFLQQQPLYILCASLPIPGWLQVLIVGTDVPDLSSRIICQAVAALDTYQVGAV